MAKYYRQRSTGQEVIKISIVLPRKIHEKLSKKAVKNEQTFSLALSQALEKQLFAGSKKTGQKTG